MFIGIVSLSNNRIMNETSNKNYKIWLDLGVNKVFGFTADARMNYRKLYWTIPGQTNVVDGDILWANMDSPFGVAHSLKSNINQLNIIDPMGIAIHHKKMRIYWVDKSMNTTTSTTPAVLQTVLRSCDFDGLEYSEVYIYRQVDNHTVSTNVTDLVIDFFHNNTAFMIDNGNPSAIIATNLDFPDQFNETNAGTRFRDMQETHLICNNTQIIFGNAQYLAVDIDITLVLWTDYIERKVNYARYIPVFLDNFVFGPAYEPDSRYNFRSRFRIDYSPVGISFDPGFGPPDFSHYDCFGRGRCTEADGEYSFV